MEAKVRPAGDIASRTVRVTLGGKVYPLTVLTMAGNERWRAYETERTADFNTELTKLGGRGPAAVAKYNEEPDMWLDVLYAYDTDCGRRAGVLPPREELKELIYEDEPEAAVEEVMWAANPTPAAVIRRLEAMAAAKTNGSSQPTSSSPPPTAGRSKRSGKH